MAAQGEIQEIMYNNTRDLIKVRGILLNVLILSLFLSHIKRAEELLSKAVNNYLSKLIFFQLI